MKKVFIVIFMLIALTAAMGAETKIISMPDLMKVDQVFFDDTQMYVVENTTIYIFSQKDFKLINKFGKQGEGPKEFMIDPRNGARPFLSKYGKDLLVHSQGKVSWFTTGGEYIKEKKLPYAMTMFVQATGKNLVGRQITMAQPMMQVLTLYGPDLAELKILAQKPHSFQMGKGTNLMKFPPPIQVHDGKCFFAWSDDFNIQVTDTHGKPLYTIKRDEKKRKITKQDQTNVINFVKTSPIFKDVFPFMKPFHFDEYFPAIQFVAPTGDKLYVGTFQRDEKKNAECLIMDLKGKLLKRTHLPLQMSGPIMPYPFAIHNGAIYQLVENEDEEEWSLHITKIL